MKIQQHDDIDRAIYIKFKNREWCVWVNPQNDLLGIPVDEKSCTADELLELENYLYVEGFFKSYYESKLAESNNF
jgi:hypothetical protein